MRFQTKDRPITGLLKNITLERNGRITCGFVKNGSLETIFLHNVDIVDVVTFCTSGGKLVFIKYFEEENEIWNIDDFN